MSTAVPSILSGGGRCLDRRRQCCAEGVFLLALYLRESSFLLHLDFSFLGAI